MLISELAATGKLLLDPEDVVKYGHYIGTIHAMDNGYIHCYAYDPSLLNRVSTTIGRLLLGITDTNLEVDHKNRNSLDNRRLNLRVATHSQNSQNRRMRNDNSSGFKGVSWNKRCQHFQVYINVKGKRVYLGSTLDAIAGARMRDDAAKQYHGEFAVLNFPEIPS